MNEGSEIQTHSGLYVNPLDLSRNDIRLEDIAHALSNQCRYAGHTRVFYSVAEHSVRVAALVADKYPDDPAIQLRALLHDATEAYLVDLPRPLKIHTTFGKVYRKYERAAEAVIMDAFGLVGVPKKKVIGEADTIMLATERRDLMPEDDTPWAVLEGVEPTAEKISFPLAPPKAEELFGACALALVSQRQEV